MCVMKNLLKTRSSKALPEKVMQRRPRATEGKTAVVLQSRPPCKPGIPL
jgi:hypothetical protein